MLKKLYNDVFFNDYVVFLKAEFDNVTVFSDDMGLLNVDLNNVSLDDTNFDNHDSETTIHVKFMAWCIWYKKCKTCKKEISKELIPAV